jgi:hypothetical protein
MRNLRQYIARGCGTFAYMGSINSKEFLVIIDDNNQFLYDTIHFTFNISNHSKSFISRFHDKFRYHIFTPELCTIELRFSVDENNTIHIEFTWTHNKFIITLYISKSDGYYNVENMGINEAFRCMLNRNLYICVK